MAFTEHLTKLAWGGALFGAEIWSCSLHLISVDTPGTDTSQAYATALQDWWERPESTINPGAKFEYIKANEVDPLTGRQSNTEQTSVWNWVPGLSGPTGSAGYGQLSLCVSLVTAAARGRASKGRFYPPTAVGVGNLDNADGALSASAAQAAANSAKTLITDINAVGTAKVCVFSSIGQSARVVTGVRVGRIMDTMRSRRNALAEGYVGATLA